MYHKGKDTMKVNTRTWIQIDTFSYICWLAHDNERAWHWCTKPRSYALIEFTQPANCFCCFSGLIVSKEMACILLRRLADYVFILALLSSWVKKTQKIICVFACVICFMKKIHAFISSICNSRWVLDMCSRNEGYIISKFGYVWLVLHTIFTN